MSEDLKDAIYSAVIHGTSVVKTTVVDDGEGGQRIEQTLIPWESMLKPPPTQEGE